MHKIPNEQKGSFFSSQYSLHMFDVFCTINYITVVIFRLSLAVLPGNHTKLIMII